jgi:phosphotransferase system enzyme I (PtsI)
LRRPGSTTSCGGSTRAAADSREQLVDIQARLAERRPELSSLFDAQLLMLDDPMLLPRAADIVREQRVNAEWAVAAGVPRVQRGVRGVRRSLPPRAPGRRRRPVGRLRMNLRKGLATPRDLLRDLDEASVLIADELTPSIAAQVDWTKVRGFATDAGSRPITPRSWRDRSTSRRWSACTTRASWSRRVSWW